MYRCKRCGLTDDDGCAVTHDKDGYCFCIECFKLLEGGEERFSPSAQELDEVYEEEPNFDLDMGDDYVGEDAGEKEVY